MLVERILAWAAATNRRLPWRGERDPYRVLVSEVMLQQTQASRVALAYDEFLERFGSVESLAEAAPEDVLRAWGSLGYNRRALFLWRAARAVVEAGAFPDDVEGLERLPGVGRYTAGAVASFAFGRDVAVVEANVQRILTRLHGLAPDADVSSLAAALLPRGRAAAWNQALMDLGSLVCRPRTPDCGACPVADGCRWADGERPPRTRAAVRGGSFAESTRYARGRVVATLRASRTPMRPADIAAEAGLASARVSEAIDSLVRDGIVSVARGRVALGPRAGVSAPATGAARRR